MEKNRYKFHFAYTIYEHNNNFINPQRNYDSDIYINIFATLVDEIHIQYVYTKAYFFIFILMSSRLYSLWCID